MKKCTLQLIDEINIKFEGLDVVTRRKLSDASKYFLPYARHVPAFKLGRWDGTIRYCDIGGRSYFHMLEKLLPIVEAQGYTIDISDLRGQYQFSFEDINANSYDNIKWPKGHTHQETSIILRDYQIQVINEFLKNPHGIQCVSTGAGKTIITAVLSHQVEKYGRTVVIVPNRDLVLQTETDYKILGLDVGVFYGERKEYNKQHTICTWQSLESLNKKTKNDEADITIDDFIKDVVCVMVDECHRVQGDVLKRLLSQIFSNVPLRWGLTGTIPEDEWYAMALYCCIGPLLQEVKAKELQDKGVLSDLHVNMIQTDDPVLTFRTFQEELKWLVTNKDRLEFISNHINLQKEQGNTLVLVDRIETGERLKELIEDSVFINGSVKTKDRKEEYQDINSSKNKVLIATYGVASTGINLPRIFNLYLIEPGKSFIRVIQSIGRGIRKAPDKDFVNVFDIYSTTKYSKKHSSKRKKFYEKAEYPFTITKETY